MIKNTRELATSGLRKDGVAIIESAFMAVVPEKAIEKKVWLDKNILFVNKTAYDLDEYKNIYVVGFGKSSSHMAKTLENILKDKITGGVVISTQKIHLDKITFYPGTHPFPSRQNMDATKRLVNIVGNTDKDDLILCLISGGGSALLFYPNIPFDEYTKKIKEIFNSGVDIFKLNSIRKSLSNVKGGKLAKMTTAKIVSMIFSDVIRDDLGAIASGPTYCASGLDNVDNHLLLTNKVALTAMEEKARELGYTPAILTSTLEGEARVVAKNMVKNTRNACDCFLFAGETIVKVKGNGTGGRNQEFCLAVIEDIAGEKETLLISAGTDGIDGPGHGAAGAVVCNRSFANAVQKGLDYKAYLENNDAYHFFKEMDDLIITGATGSNVADVGVILKRQG